MWCISTSSSCIPKLHLEMCISVHIYSISSTVYDEKLLVNEMSVTFTNILWWKYVVCRWFTKVLNHLVIRHWTPFFLCLLEFKECFSLYDRKRKGKIDAKDLITVMRCLGTSPTFGEVDRHLQISKIGKRRCY